MYLTVDEMLKNLLDGWGMTDESHHILGKLWYPTAHDLAGIVGHGDYRMGAGVIAALSPNKAWDTNRALALAASNGVLSGHVGDALRKTERILNGEDPVNVLPMHKKTGHFFWNILYPLDSSHVTIDRHAIRAATSDWDNGNPRIKDSAYDDFVLANQKAAAEVGVPAPTFQAILWMWARARKS